ncbi:unnamed protein product [Jaminaea pallidilutea]
MKTFEVVKESDLPEGKTVVGCKWVMTRKVDANGNPVKYKARLVAQGFTQRYGIDYEDTFNPVIRLETLRQLLAVATQMGYHIMLMDVQTAYLNGINHSEIYMRVPSGFEAPPESVLRVHRALYGLKQSGREWYLELRHTLVELAFEQCAYDPCIFIHPRGVTIAVYVDDLFLIARSKGEASWARDLLQSRYTMTESPITNAFLGICIEKIGRKDEGIRLHQRPYIEAVLKRTGMSDCHPASIPMSVSKELTTYEGEALPEEEKKEYLARIGCLLWIAMVTRPDISYAVSHLACFSASPGPEHFTAVEQVLRYLKGTLDLCLTYTPNMRSEGENTLPLKMLAYSDADWAGDKISRRSRTGWAIFIEGMLVSWSSRMQRSVAHSTLDAEYVALADTSKQTVIISSALNEAFGYIHGGTTIRRPVDILTDSKGAVVNAKELASHSGVKHIEVRYHIVKWYQENDIVKVSQVPSKQNLADQFTKPTAGSALNDWRAAVDLLSKTPVVNRKASGNA